jgi:hypothetical protein
LLLITTHNLIRNLNFVLKDIPKKSAVKRWRKLRAFIKNDARFYDETEKSYEELALFLLKRYA